MLFYLFIVVLHFFVISSWLVFNVVNILNSLVAFVTLSVVPVGSVSRTCEISSSRNNKGFIIIQRW